MSRKHRKGLRSLYRRFNEPFFAVPLSPDDAELRALVALRCMQQDYHADAARAELVVYARRCGVRDVENVVDDVLREVVQNFVSGPPGGGLRKYIQAITRAVRGQAAADLAGVTDRSRRYLLTVPEAARELGVSRRALYNWIGRGIVVPAKKRTPYRIARAEIERARERVAAKPGTLYRRVMELRGFGYDAARKWVGRRRAKGVPEREIIEDAGASNRVDQDQERQELRVELGLDP
jgi:excisionase family DNA binding protein